MGYALAKARSGSRRFRGRIPADGHVRQVEPRSKQPDEYGIIG